MIESFATNMTKTNRFSSVVLSVSFTAQTLYQLY